MSASRRHRLAPEPRRRPTRSYGVDTGLRELLLRQGEDILRKKNGTGGIKNEGVGNFRMKPTVVIEDETALPFAKQDLGYTGHSSRILRRFQQQANQVAKNQTLLRRHTSANSPLSTPSFSGTKKKTIDRRRWEEGTHGT